MSGLGDLAEQRVALERGERAHVAGHVADRGDAAHQGAAQPALGSRPGVFARGLGRDVDVGVDQARDQIAAGQIVDLGARRRGAGSRRVDRGDALAFDQHGLVRPGRAAGAVEQRDAGQHDAAGAVGRGLSPGGAAGRDKQQRRAESRERTDGAVATRRRSRVCGRGVELPLHVVATGERDAEAFGEVAHGHSQREARRQVLVV